MTLFKIPSQEITLNLADWNAKVGDKTNHVHIRSTVGRYGVGVGNDSGTKFLKFCIDHKPTVLNTCFQDHTRRFCTWTSPGDRWCNQIDYVIINSQWRNSLNVKTFPGADCGSDHCLLVASFALRLKVTRKGPPVRRHTLTPLEIIHRDVK